MPGGGASDGSVDQTEMVGTGRPKLGEIEYGEIVGCGYGGGGGGRGVVGSVGGVS